MIKPGAVRFILAMIVVIYHLSKFIYFGNFAVLVFFMLSGYWVSLMYDVKYKTLKSPKTSFYISRAWRVLPVFFIINILALLTHYFYHSAQWLVLKNMSISETGFYIFSNVFLFGFYNNKVQLLYPAWSLDIEFQFYLFFPLIFKICSNSAIRRYLLLFFALLFQVIISIYFEHSLLHKTLPNYIFYFLIGMNIYLSKGEVSKGVEYLFNSIFLIILTAQYIFEPLRNITLIDGTTNYNKFLNQFLPLLLIPFISNSVLRKSGKIDRLLGDISFEIYLTQGVLIFIYNRYAADIGFIARLPYASAFVIFTLLLSFIVYKLFDNPIDSLRRKWIKVRAEKLAIATDNRNS